MAFFITGGVYKLILGCDYNPGNKRIWCPYKNLKGKNRGIIDTTPCEKYNRKSMLCRLLNQN